MSTAEKRKIRIGIWGVGRAGWSMHRPELDNFPDEFEIVAACDTMAERLDLVKKDFPNAKTYIDSDQFLADPNMELVTVAVRSPQHVDYALRALNAGKYVFLEKPIALTTAGADKLAEAIKQFPGKLYFRHNRRFEPCFNHILEIIHSGILGDVYEIKLCRHNYQFRGDWQTIIDCGGGQLNNWGPHLIDHGLQLLESPLASIWSKLKTIAARGDAEDHLKIIMTGENDRIIDIEISGGISLPSPIYAVYGTRGSLISEDEQDIKLKYLHPDMAMPDTPADPGTPPLRGGFGGSVAPKWIRKTIMVEPANGRKTDDIYHALYLTIREGAPYPIDPQEAFNVVKVTEAVKKQNPSYRIKEDEFGK